MSARKLSKKPHVMTRTHEDGKIYTYAAATERLARTAVFSSAHYNSNAPKREANAFADSFDVGNFRHVRFLLLHDRGGIMIFTPGISRSPEPDADQINGMQEAAIHVSAAVADLARAYNTLNVVSAHAVRADLSAAITDLFRIARLLDPS